MNQGPGNALLSPSCTVHVAGSARGLTVTFHPPLPAAGAEPPIADTPDAVAAVPAVLDTDSGAADRDRVEHEGTIAWNAERYRAIFGSDPPSEPETVQQALERVEQERQARLRRWQAIG